MHDYVEGLDRRRVRIHLVRGVCTLYVLSLVVRSIQPSFSLSLGNLVVVSFLSLEKASSQKRGKKRLGRVALCLSTDTVFTVRKTPSSVVALDVDTLSVSSACFSIYLRIHVMSIQSAYLFHNPSLLLLLSLSPDLYFLGYPHTLFSMRGLHETHFYMSVYI